MRVTFEKAPSAVIQEKGDKHTSNGISGYPDLGRGSHFKGSGMIQSVLHFQSINQIPA